MGPPHTNTIVIAAQIEFKFVAEDDMVPFRCSLIPLLATSLQTKTSMDRCHWRTRSERRDIRYSSARRAHIEGSAGL
ncbi:hypothetical protein TNCV_3589791 [Trichonephila clavipes]|nr:hypothetical protein TNCV_3589791 [Trichonephila clavipes]